jgi:hypothetical protein
VAPPPGHLSFGMTPDGAAWRHLVPPGAIPRPQRRMRAYGAIVTQGDSVAFPHFRRVDVEPIPH